jgi:molybdopterin-guanine dinucleotide biosynthesis protein A
MDAPGIARLGVLVAGGRGDRLGFGRPKAWALAGGETLLERAARSLADCTDERVVVAPRAMELPGGPWLRVDDPPGPPGPLAAIVAGLGSRRFARALVLGVDYPLVGAPLLAAILDRLGAAIAAVPYPAGRAQPLVAAYADRAAPRLAAARAAGERSLVAAVEQLGPERLDDATLAGWPGGRDAFLNVNSPDDLAEAERRLAAARAGAAS